MDIVLVGGLWLDASVWDDVVERLAAGGHRAVAVALPGQGGPGAGASAMLEDQVQAVLDVVDAAGEPVLLVGHSAACTLVWIVADRRPQKVARVAMIGGMPSAAGEQYAAFFPLQDGAMPFPGWEPFEGPDSDDLSQEQKDALAADAHPVPGGVAEAEVQYADAARKAIPVVLLCPEYSPEDAKAWRDAGDVPELDDVEVSYVDLPTGHWPMVSAPEDLARALADLT